MPDAKTRTDFFAKMWFRYVAGIFVTWLTLLCIFLGPLFLFGVLKDANGNHAIDAGIAMSIIAIPLFLTSALLWFNILARRKPLLRICSEGVEVNVIGSSSLDGVPLIP